MQLIFSLCLWTKTQWQGTSRCRQEFIPFPNDIFRLQMSLLHFQSLDLTFLFLNFVQLILFGRTSIFPFSSILFCMDCFIVENVLFLFEPLSCDFVFVQSHLWRGYHWVVESSNTMCCGTYGGLIILCICTSYSGRLEARSCEFHYQIS